MGGRVVVVYDLYVFRRMLAPRWLTSGPVILIILIKMVSVRRFSKVLCKWGVGGK